MINIDFTEKEIDEAVQNYETRSDESYAIHTAWMLWEKLIEMGIIKK